MTVLLLQNANIISDTAEKGTVCGFDILIENGLIKQLSPAGRIHIKEEHTAVNLTGKTVLPGLINSHVHITFEPIGNPIALFAGETRTKTVLRAVANLKKQLHSGVTFFRDLGGPEHIDIELRDCIRDGTISGPEFLASGKFITITGGHGHEISRECDGRDDARKAAREQLKAGADVIKFMATGGVMTGGVDPGSPQLTVEEMRAIIEEAHHAGKKASAHALGTSGIINAVLSGVDSIEHGSSLDYAAIELMLKNDVYLVPTLAASYLILQHGVEGGIPEYAVEKSKREQERHYKSFETARKAGVKIAMGTDAGTPFNRHDGVALELQLMVECGMSPLEAITAATQTSAELLGIADRYGSIAEGKAADLVVVEGNPLKDIRILKDVKQVYKKGIRII